ncbi:MAG: oligosaccharide flippase family protein [Candidatus Aenigmatarchaeota archaeon]
MVNNKGKLISNTIYLFLEWFVVNLLSFLYWLTTGKTLLPEEYGIVSTTTNLAMVLSGISLLGLNLSVMKLLPEYLSRKENKKVVSLMRISLQIIILTNLAIALILILFSVQIASSLKVPITVVWISIAILFAVSFSNQFGSIIYGFQNMRQNFISNFFGQLTKVFISMLLIFLGLGYLGPLLGFLLGFLLIAFMRFKFSYYYFSSSTEKINIKKIMKNYALPAFVSFLAWTLFLNGQYVLLTILKNPEATGIFTIAMVLTSIVATLPSILNSALFPVISSLSIDRNSEKNQSYLIQLVFRYSLFLTLPIAAFLTIFSKPVILIFSRPEYLKSSELFPILVTGSLIYGLGNIFLSSLYAIGKTKTNMNIVILTTLLFLCLAIPLASFLAEFGMALAYTLTVILLTLLSFFYLRKNLKIKFPLKNMIKCLVAVFVSILFLYITTGFTASLITGIPLAIIAGLIYLEILILLRFYVKEDVKILEFFASKSPVFKKEISFLAKFLSKHT